jgi:hypothetical protein
MMSISASRKFDPWLEELNRRSATLFVHPTITRAGETLLNGLNASTLEFMFDTTRMITNMVATGAKKCFSQIKIISTHDTVFQHKERWHESEKENLRRYSLRQELWMSPLHSIPGITLLCFQSFSGI